MLTLTVKCPQCEEAIREQGKPDAIIGIDVAVPLTNERFHPWTCRFGHEWHLWLEHPFYELLLYRAFQDLEEENRRGAVLGFYSAWDNFVVDFLRWFSISQGGGVVGDPPPAQLNRAEPRLGMYAAAVAQLRRGWPKLASQRSTTLRNKVIHDNAMPTLTETLRLADDLRECIREGQETLDLMFPHDPPYDAPFIFESEVNAHPEIDGPVLTYGLPASFAADPASEILGRWPVPLGKFLGIGNVPPDDCTE